MLIVPFQYRGIYPHFLYYVLSLPNFLLSCFSQNGSKILIIPSKTTTKWSYSLCCVLGLFLQYEIFSYCQNRSYPQYNSRGDIQTTEFYTLSASNHLSKKIAKIDKPVKSFQKYFLIQDKIIEFS